MAAILPAGLRNGVKGLDANRYATKKTVAQGMLDIALLTSNASQLKYVLQVGPKHEFYTLLVVLISISIVLQVAMGLVLLSLNLLRDCRFHDPRHKESALTINYGTTATAFVVTVLNILVSAFDSSLARYLEIPASAGVLALVISFFDGEGNQRQKKIADWLYHTSVGMMTGVVFCDVIKMTFGLDPALSEEDSLGRSFKPRHPYVWSASTYSYFVLYIEVLSAAVAVVLSCIFNINKQDHQRNAEILNNTSLLFKVCSIAVNILISIFYSMELDNNVNI